VIKDRLAVGDDEMAESSEESQELAESLSIAQLEKLRLEVEGIRNKNKWEERIARYIPLITVSVAVAGLLFGIWEFQRQQSSQQEKIISEQQKDRASQDLDRTLRIQSQIRTDTDQLLRFTNDPAQTLSRVAFLLDDLNVLAHERVGESQEGSQIILNSRETVTRSLIKMIHYDCDFLKNPRDVYFATTVLDHWPDYSQHLGQNLRELDFVLYKYVRALRDLHDKNPRYFEKIVYDSSSGRYIVNSENFNEEHQFQHYGDIVIGFMKHLSVMRSSDLMKKHIREFEAALRNPELTRELFSEYLSNIDRINAGTLVLTPTPVRSAGEIKKIVLDRSIPTFTVSVALQEDVTPYGTLRASIFDSVGRQIWQQTGITMTRPGRLTFTLNSTQFPTGDYGLVLDAGLPNGESVTLERYYFRVTKK
jgi:hypothetical protein